MPHAHHRAQVSLSGSLSFGSLITRLPNGPTFDVDVGDVLTISNPSVMYVRSNATVNGTLAPGGGCKAHHVPHHSERASGEVRKLLVTCDAR